MTLSVRAVGGPTMAAGLGLAGLAVTVVADATAAADRVEELAAEPGNGVILIEERWHDALPDDLRARLDRTPVPMLVPFPAPVWIPPHEAADAYVVALLRRAIGYRVKIA